MSYELASNQIEWNIRYAGSLPRCDYSDATKCNEILRGQERDSMKIELRKLMTAQGILVGPSRWSSAFFLNCKEQYLERQTGWLETQGAISADPCISVKAWRVQASHISGATECNLAFCGPGFWNCLITGPNTIPVSGTQLDDSMTQYIARPMPLLCAVLMLCIMKASRQRNQEWSWQSNLRILSWRNESLSSLQGLKENIETQTKSNPSSRFECLRCWNSSLTETRHLSSSSLNPLALGRQCDGIAWRMKEEGGRESSKQKGKWTHIQIKNDQATKEQANRSQTNDQRTTGSDRTCQHCTACLDV